MENSDLPEEIDCIAASKHPVTSCPSINLKRNAPEANADGVHGDLSQGTAYTNDIISRSHSGDPPLTIEDVLQVPLSTDRSLKNDGRIFESERSHSVLGPGHMETATPTTGVTNQSVIVNIEDRIRAMMRRLQMKEESWVLVRIKKRSDAGALLSSEPGGGHEEGEVLVKFPGQTATEAWRFGR